MQMPKAPTGNMRMKGRITAGPYRAWSSAITGSPFTGKPTTSPDHRAPSAWAAEVTTSTVSAETATRTATSETEMGPRRRGAVSGRPRTTYPAARHTAAANGIAVSGPSGIVLRISVATTKVSVPTVTPVATDRARGEGTSRVATR